MLRRLLALTGAAFLAACGGGGSTQSPVAFATSAPQSAGPMSLSIFIPTSTTSPSSTRRSPTFVSPSTNGLSITDCVHGASPCTAFTGNVDLSSSSSACTTVGNGRSCSVSITASQGSNDFTFTTYDVTPPTSGFGTAAHQLGTSSISGLTIASGTNTVNVALGGTIASVKLNLTQRSVYGYSALTTSVGVTALDADNNIIVAGATTVSNTGAGSQTDTYSNPIAVAVTESGGSGHTKLSLNGGSAATSVTTTKSSDAIALSYDGNAGGSSYFATVMASTTNAAGSPVSASANLNTISITANGVGIGYFAGGASPKTIFASGTGESETITVTETNGAGSFAPVGVANLGSTNCPSGSVGLSASSFGASGSTFTIGAGTVNTAGTGCVVTFTDVFGGSISIAETESTPQSLYVGNAGSNTVTIYNQPFSNSSTPSVTMTSGFNNPNSVVFDSSGTLYVANYAGNNVAAYTSPFTSGSTANAVSLSNLNGPQDLLFPSPGNLYVSNYNNNTITLYQTISGAFSQNGTISTGLSGPQQMALDSSNNLYVANRTGGVNIYSSPYTGAPATITTGLAGPQGVSFDSSGNLYVATCPSCAGSGATSSVQIYRPPFSSGSSPSVTITSGVSQAFRVAFDAIGNLYVSNSGTNTVTIYTPSTSNPPFSSASTPSVTIATGTTPVGVALH
jgi:hypothetical protein